MLFSITEWGLHKLLKNSSNSLFKNSWRAEHHSSSLLSTYYRKRYPLQYHIQYTRAYAYVHKAHISMQMHITNYTSSKQIRRKGGGEGEDHVQEELERYLMSQNAWDTVQEALQVASISKTYDDLDDWKFSSTYKKWALLDLQLDPDSCCARGHMVPTTLFLKSQSELHTHFPPFAQFNWKQSSWNQRASCSFSKYIYVAYKSCQRVSLYDNMFWVCIQLTAVSQYLNLLPTPQVNCLFWGREMHLRSSAAAITSFLFFISFHG